jgi:hypothetical protein
MKSLRQILVLVFVLAPVFNGLAAVKIEGPMPARDGETCAVCNTPVTDKDVAYLVDGQRIAVMEAMQEEFLRNPLLYVTKFRPEGMVFSARQSGSLNSGYLWLGMYVLVGLLFGGACAHVAMSKGLPSWRWFFLGFFFSVPACLAVAGKKPAADAPEVPDGLGKIPATRAPAACPECGAGNHPAAHRCLGCGAVLQPSVSSEVGA